MTHNKESTAVWNLQPERPGLPWVQEKMHHGEKVCDKKEQQQQQQQKQQQQHNNNNNNNNGK